jgi:hypothetical protein
MTAARPRPSQQARRFLLIRRRDVSGVTGTGVVAEGIQFSDRTVAVRWYGAAPATAVWQNVDAVLAVHGHSGATVIHWLDHPPQATDRPTPNDRRTDSLSDPSGQTDLARAAASPSLVEPGSDHGADPRQPTHTAHRP